MFLCRIVYSMRHILSILRGGYALKNFYETYNKMEKMVLGIILLFLIIMGFVSVICRFVLHMPLAWSEEIMLFCMVWTTYLGASTAANERKHIRVSMFVNLLPKSMQKTITILSELLWIACAILLFYLGYIVTFNYIKSHAATLGGGFPYWIAAISIPIGMLLMVIRIIVSIYDTLHGKTDEQTVEEIIKEAIES